MRKGVRLAEARRVQLSVELARDEAGRMIGSVALAGAPPNRFTGVLDLLRLLEELAVDGTPPNPQEGT